MIKNPILGTIAGDMIGVPYECLRHGVSVSPDFPLWGDRSTFSDDSVMTLAVAKWLLESKDFDYEVLIKCMQELGRKYRDRGYGSSFGQWLDTDNPKPYNSWGNGSAMRVSPVGVVSDKEENILALAGLTANVSHNHPEGIKGAQAIAFCVWAAWNNWSKSAMKIGLRDHIHDYDLNRTPQQIMDSGYTFKVSCQESVPEAICCFLNSDSYEETVRKAILLRGDTDTQAAMAGGIAAAYWGMPEDIAEEAKNRLPQDLYVILSKFSKKYNLPL